MRSVSALDVRKHFGRILDEAGRGERFVIERAGQPVAALVPLEDLAMVDPEQQHARRMAAVEELRHLGQEARGLYGPWEDFDAVAAVRADRDRDGRWDDAPPDPDAGGTR
jgi:prevent-host-death family protein